ncbi:cytochrome P450 [Mycena rosella]|uniref:Cytochrome P450 n=1 Tax=Mycena rosella TaxID=1033263 RepID=A0AAD7G192_MYCRO|nr:cytochrome P450 [Mycena rosella]
MWSSLLQTAFLVVAGCAVTAILRRVFSRCNTARVHHPNLSSQEIRSNTTTPLGGGFQRELEDNYGGIVLLRGLFNVPILFVSDAVALHTIVNKEMDIYEEAPPAVSMSYLMFGRGILSTLGHEHRKLRKMMVLEFSTANLRGMISHFYEIGEKVRDGLMAPQVMAGPQELNMASILTRTSLELIGRSGLDYSFDPLILDCPKNEYAETIKNFMPVLGKVAMLLPLLPFFTKFVDASYSGHDRFDGNTAKDIIKAKKAALQDGNLESQENMQTGTDIMSVLPDESSRLPDEELAAQTSSIIFAAMDTTSSALCRVFNVLASFPDVQEKLRAEIVEATAHKENGHLDHDDLMELAYLDSVLREILRLYPPVPTVHRETITPSILPLGMPITATDGSTLTSIPVPKGTPVLIALAKANHNAAIWGDDAHDTADNEL